MLESADTYKDFAPLEQTKRKCTSMNDLYSTGDPDADLALAIQISLQESVNNATVHLTTHSSCEPPQESTERAQPGTCSEEIPAASSGSPVPQGTNYLSKPLKGNALLASLAAERHARRGLPMSQAPAIGQQGVPPGEPKPRAPRLVPSSSPVLSSTPHPLARSIPTQTASKTHSTTTPQTNFLLPPTPYTCVRAARYCPITLTYVSAFARAGSSDANRFSTDLSDICPFVPERVILTTAAIEPQWLLSHAPMLARAKHFTLVPHCSALPPHRMGEAVPSAAVASAHRKPDVAEALLAWQRELRSGMPAASIVSVHPPLMGSAFGCQHAKLLLYTHHGASAQTRGVSVPPWLRVVVGTANMLPNEVCDKNQAHWVHDAPALTVSTQRAREWRHELYGAGPLLHGVAATRMPCLSPVGALSRASTTYSALSPLVLSALHLAALALKQAFLALASWLQSTASTDEGATACLDRAPMHVQSLVGVCSRLWSQCLADALVLSQALLHRDMAALLDTMSARSGADVGAAMLAQYDLLSAGVALVPTAPLAVPTTLGSHGLARLHGLLSHAHLASRLSLPGRGRVDWWTGDAQVLRSAAASTAAAEALFCDPAATARPSWPLPAPIAQASSLGSPQGWLAPLAAALSAHHWRVEEGSAAAESADAAVFPLATGFKRKAAGPTQATSKRARKPLALQVPLRVVWPSLKQVLQSVEGLQAGGWLLLQGRAHLLIPLWLHLHRWADWGGRGAAMPHIKSYTQPLRSRGPAEVAGHLRVLQKLIKSALPSLGNRVRASARTRGYVVSDAAAEQFTTDVAQAARVTIPSDDTGVQEDVPIEWAVVTSANMSQSAWGALKPLPANVQVALAAMEATVEEARWPTNPAGAEAGCAVNAARLVLGSGYWAHMDGDYHTALRAVYWDEADTVETLSSPSVAPPPLTGVVALTRARAVATQMRNPHTAARNPQSVFARVLAVLPQDSSLRAGLACLGDTLTPDAACTSDSMQCVETACRSDWGRDFGYGGGAFGALTTLLGNPYPHEVRAAVAMLTGQGPDAGADVCPNGLSEHAEQLRAGLLSMGHFEAGVAVLPPLTAALLRASGRGHMPPEALMCDNNIGRSAGHRLTDDAMHAPLRLRLDVTASAGVAVEAELQGSLAGRLREWLAAAQWPPTEPVPAGALPLLCAAAAPDFCVTAVQPHSRRAAANVACRAGSLWTQLRGAATSTTLKEHEDMLRRVHVCVDVPLPYSLSLEPYVSEASRDTLLLNAPAHEGAVSPAMVRLSTEEGPWMNEYMGVQYP